MWNAGAEDNLWSLYNIDSCEYGCTDRLNIHDIRLFNVHVLNSNSLHYINSILSCFSNEMLYINLLDLRQIFELRTMRVDLSPRLGGTHTCVPPTLERSTASRVANQPPPQYCPHSRCGTESWTELELAFHLTVTFLIRLQGPNDSLH